MLHVLHIRSSARAKKSTKLTEEYHLEVVLVACCQEDTTITSTDKWEIKRATRFQC